MTENIKTALCRGCGTPLDKCCETPGLCCDVCDHYTEIAFLHSPKYHVEQVEGGYRVLSRDGDGAFS